MRLRSVGALTFDELLQRLGADLPTWRREWFPEAELFGDRADWREVAKALDRFAREEGALLHVRSKGDERYWFLARPPVKPSSPESPKRSQVPKAVEMRGGASSVQELKEEAEGTAIDEEECVGKAAPILPTPRVELGQVVPESESPASEQTQPLLRVLRSVGIRVAEVDSRPIIGPNIIRHRVLLHPAERTETLRRRAEDIGREMGCRIMVSQIPGERYLAIDVPRSDRQVVPLLPALALLKGRAKPGELRTLVGVTPAGEAVTVDLATLPRVLFAGASGSGKTMEILVWLLCFAQLLPPDQLDIVIVDPKGLDFWPLARLPHLRKGLIIDDPAQAVEVLRDITGLELAARTRILQEAGCSSFRELRARYPGAEAKNLVIAIDEYADIITTLPKDEREDFERQVMRLAQRARAVGVHLIVATQRPTVDLITGSVKANLPSRISFRLPQRTDSLVILDQAGAETLLGAGDMLLLHEGCLQRLQGYYVSTSEVASLVDQLAEGRSR